MGLFAVPDDHVATVVTSLEMRACPPLRPMPSSPLRLRRWPAPALARYRALFRRVGEPWLWFSRLMMADERLRAILDDPGTEVFAVEDRAGIEVGLLELNLREAGQCELGYVGLVPELVGRGHGGWLMAEALARAWRPGVTRVWVNTCTLDHPRALGFYRHAGFTPFRRTLETFIDPRVAGMLGPDAGPHIPRLSASAAGTAPV